MLPYLVVGKYMTSSTRDDGKQNIYPGFLKCFEANGTNRTKHDNTETFTECMPIGVNRCIVYCVGKISQEDGTDTICRKCIDLTVTECHGNNLLSFSSLVSHSSSINLSRNEGLNERTWK